jgi:hypothetical protein
MSVSLMIRRFVASFFYPVEPDLISYDAVMKALNRRRRRPDLPRVTEFATTVPAAALYGRLDLFNGVIICQLRLRTAGRFWRGRTPRVSSMISKSKKGGEAAGLLRYIFAQRDGENRTREIVADLGGTIPGPSAGEMAQHASHLASLRPLLRKNVAHLILRSTLVATRPDDRLQVKNSAPPPNDRCRVRLELSAAQ